MRRLRFLMGRHRAPSVDRSFGLLLAFNAGAVNAGGFLVLHMYTSHMTGFASQLADGLVLGNTVLVLNALGALLAFICGAATSAMQVNWGRQYRLRSVYALPLMLEAVLLLLFGLVGAITLSWRTPFAVPLTVLLLSFIMGLQNAMGTKSSGGKIRTTHMTGNVTDLGIELGKMLYWNRRGTPVAALVRHCLEAGAAKVSVLDHTCDQWQACYSNSGIEQAVRKSGGEMLSANDQGSYQEVPLPRGKVLKKAKIHRAIMESDVWFNVPVLKSHGGAGMTVSMKNLMGIVWDRGYFHWHDLNQCIADICTLPKPPVLNIVDAYRVLAQGGPRGGRGKDVLVAKGLFASPDMVAVDTAAMPLENISYLQKGAELAVGTTDPDTLAIRRRKL